MYALLVRRPLPNRALNTTPLLSAPLNGMAHGLVVARSYRHQPRYRLCNAAPIGLAPSPVFKQHMRGHMCAYPPKTNLFRPVRNGSRPCLAPGNVKNGYSAESKIPVIIRTLVWNCHLKIWLYYTIDQMDCQPLQPIFGTSYKVASLLHTTLLPSNIRFCLPKSPPKPCVIRLQGMQEAK